MITNKDSLGNELTKEQIEYFKNTKIVDKNNNLLVVYHGSPTPYFKEFNPRDNKSQFGKYKFGDKNVNYFTTDRKSASTYTEFGYDDGTLFEVYLNIENPYIVDNKSEAEIKSHLNIKDDRLRKQQLELFDRIFNKWKDKILDYSDYRFDELNNDLHKLNLELRPSDCYDEGTDPMDIDYFDLWNLGRNSFMGAEHIIEYQYSTDELFNDDMYDELKSKIVGEDHNDYFFSTDDIVRFVLSLDEGYDGIIIKDIHDSKDMFSDITTDIITLGSPNQIKSISNKNPSSSNKIDENRDDFYDANLLWKGSEYSETPKNDRIRLYHQTDKKSIPSIIKNGLQTKFKRWYDNPGGSVLWATDEDPTISWSWNYGDALVVLDLPKDFDMRKVNNHEYNIYQDIDPKYINATYLKSSYVRPIMRDFQNTLDIDKSIERFKQGLLTEHLDIDYNSMSQSPKDKKLNEGEILNDVDDIDDLELYDDVETNEYDDYLDNPNDFDLEKEQRNQVDRVRARNKGNTYYIPTDIKDLLTKENYRYGWLDTFDFKVVDLEKVIKENGLDNPKHGMFYRRMATWGDNPDLYYYDTNKEDWLYSPIRINASGRIIDGNHRLWALYNNGYKYAEVLAPKESLSESLLLEVSRRQIIDKSKRGRAYAPSNQALGKNRWERKKWSRVANSTREFNSIDMNTFFKKDILIVNVPVQGETDRYIVKIKFSGVLEEIQKNVQANNNKLDYRIISQALSRVFNSGDVFINCNCLHPTTKIKLLDGTTPTVEEMKQRFDNGEKLYVYSTDKNGDFKPGEVEKVWITKTTTKFVKVTLDNGEEILTTPDHRYMMRDGSYVCAENLSVGDSLMPLYFNHIANDYESVKLNSKSRKWVSTYKAVADYFKKDLIEEVAKSDTALYKEPKGVAIHHKDFNKNNNNPENLEIMSSFDHWMYHANLLKEKWQNEEFRQRVTEMARDNAKLRNANPTEKMVEARKRNLAKGQEHNYDPDWLPIQAEIMRKVSRDYWDNLTPEQWEESKKKRYTEEWREKLSNSHKQIWKNMTEEEYQHRCDLATKGNAKAKDKISKAQKEYWQNLDDSRRNELSTIHRETTKKSWKEHPEKHLTPAFIEARKKAFSFERTPEYFRKINISKIRTILDTILSNGEIPSPETYEKYRTTIKKGYPRYTLVFKDWEELSAFYKLNHKVAKVEFVELEETPVYDIQVKDWHNFYVNSGVVLHNCMDFKTRFAHWSTVQGYNSGKPENRPNRFDWTNSHDDMGGACKHGNLVLSNLSWMMKVASVINNYIHYAEQFMQRQFADIIFPKIYGVKYPDAVQMGLFDRQYLKHSKGVIDAINQFGSTRTRFKKAPKPEQTEPEFEVHPKQLSIFDIDNEEEEIPEDKLGNKGFKKQSIFDYGVDEVKEPEEVEKPKGFKPRRDTPVIKPKGFKKLSIFDNEESEN